MLIADANAPPLTKLRPLKPARTATFPVYHGLVDHLAAAWTHPTTPSPMRSGQCERWRDVPFRYSLDDYAPQHYVSRLTPPGRPTEFGDYMLVDRAVAKLGGGLREAGRRAGPPG